MAKNKNFKTWQLVLAVFLIFLGIALSTQINSFSGIPPIIVIVVTVAFVAFGIGLFAKFLSD